MEKVNTLVIGAGIIGLAVAASLSEEREVVLVEKEDTFGRHTSSRNSEEIHSGIYYPKGSLKHLHCIRGNELLYSFCKEKGVRYKNTGKLIVANNEKELNNLKALLDNGINNGVEGLRLLTQEETKKIEPKVISPYALFVPSAGVFDTHQAMKVLEKIIEDRDSYVVYQSEVNAIEYKDNSYLIGFANGEVYQAENVINCAGLFADNIAQMLGIDCGKYSLQLNWCKGEYFRTTELQDINHLIYPIPAADGISIGLHIVVDIAGQVKIGPNAFYVDTLNYKVNEEHKEQFYNEISRIIPIDPNRLSADDSGIRPKLQGQGEGFRDFYIQEESEKGFPNWINLIGIDSPGLTSALSIAESVKKMLN